MKKTTTLILTLACLGLFQTAQAQVSITNQPADRINNIGDNAQFSVGATGTGTLSYQWKFNTVAIDGATASTLTFLLTNSSQAGSYTVVVTDSTPSSTESSPATLSIPYAGLSKLAQWNFNVAPQTDPSYGVGTYTKMGGITVTFSSSTTSPADPATPNSAWRATGWGANNSANKTRGIQLNVSTVNFKDLVVTWQQYNNPQCSRYWRLQYTTNGTDYIDYTVHTMTVTSTWVFQSSDLSGLSEVNNNPQFGLRFVSEYAYTATTNGASKFVATSDGTAGTFDGSWAVYFDLFTILGTPYTPSEVQPAIVAQPQNQTNFIGADATLSVTATGGNLHYQWRFNGGNIANATDSMLSLTSLVATNEGSYSVFINNTAGSVTSDDAYLAVLPPPPPGDRYWSGNGVVPGGIGTWDTTNAHWGTVASGPFSLAWNNTNVDTAHFYTSAATVTLGEPITVNKIDTASQNYTFSGTNVLTFAGSSEISNNGTALYLSCKLHADTLTKTGSGRVELNNTGNSVGRCIIAAGALVADNANRIAGTGNPASLVTNYFTLDGGGLGFAVGTSSSMTVGANRGIYFGPTDGNILGCQDTGKVIFDGPITGPGSVSFPGFNSWPGGFQGAAATFIFSNHSNDYQGGTTVGTGVLRCGAAEVIPDTTTVTVNGSARFDVNGFTETVGTVIVSGSNARLQDGLGGGVLIATNFDLRNGGAQTAVLGGAGNLTKTTAGSIELQGLNTYTGETFLTAGDTYLTAPGRFGSGVLHLDGGNLVFNNTRTEETILMNPVVVTNPVSLDLKSSTTSTGAVVFLSGGTWTVEQGTIGLMNSSTNAGTTFTLGLTNTVHFTDATTLAIKDATCFLASLNPAGTDQTFDCVISGLGGVRRSALSGAGGRTIINNANNYGGDTVVEAGTLLVNSIYGSGTSLGAVTVGAPSGVLGGNGIVGGPVSVTSGGSIAAGASAGILTLQNGLDMSAGGANVWELAALKDNNDGTPGLDFDQLVLSGGELQLGGSSVLVLQFAAGMAPDSTIAFWQSARSWTIVSLAGGQNTANATFASIVNGSYNAGNFSTSVDGGNIVLTFTPNAPSEPHVTVNPQSRTNIVGTTATFTVVATGSDPLTYKWYRNGAPPTQVPGQTSATCTLPNVQPSQAGNYFAVVFNGLGSATSQAATLTIVPPPKMEPPSGDGTGGVVLTWPAIAGTSYQVQYNTNLVTSNWYSLTNVVASGLTVSATDHPPVGSSERFYRLLVQ